MTLENAESQLNGLPFADKLKQLAEWLETGEISEQEAYQLITAEGNPEPKPQAESVEGFIMEFY